MPVGVPALQSMAMLYPKVGLQPDEMEELLEPMKELLSA
jgi:hypothetical protein